ncbi:MAG: histidine triad nucleotide-binding protein [Pyrinomonadaceae bacterium]
MPAALVHSDDDFIAFNDINPQAPTHVLIIPRRHIESLKDTDDDDSPLLGNLVRVATILAERLRLDDGFRIVINAGADGGQTVSHLHLHLLGGRAMTWPPG